MALPPLREELALLPGPTLAGGQPSHTLHDPSRNLFFQIDWPSFEVLKRWHLGDPSVIATTIAAETTLQMDTDDVSAVAKFLDLNQLLQSPLGHAGEWAHRARMRRGSIGEWMLHNYLFFRIPLLKPDRWLGAWADGLDWLYRSPFWLLTAIVSLLGMIEIHRNWEQFSTTLLDTFTASGMVSYAVALVAVKALHELGHAVTAKRFGCRVPTMGIAFLVLWPVAYTDTNDVWRLTSSRQRLQVAAAGILTELTVAAWATFAWSLLPEGQLKAVAFMLATITWVSSIAINASPFMRFDGYFLLSDWLEMPNLHARSFALARWDLRERLFALGEPVPEVLPRRRHAGLVLFAYATWAYRLIVFLGIAALVYAFFIKAVGVFLFMVEIVWFILLPPYREMKAWWERWPALRKSPRARRSALVAAIFLILLVVPWPSRIVASGLLRPEKQFIVYAPPHAKVVALPVKEGQRVKAGAILLQLDFPELESRRVAALAKRDRLRWQASAGSFDNEQRAQWQVAQQQLETAEAELASIAADAAHYTPTAPFDGVLRDLAPDLQPGAWLGRQEVLARLVATTEPQVVAFLGEEEISLVTVGNRARFYTDGPDTASLPLEVVRVDPDASRILAEGELASIHGGGIAVREKNGVLYPEQAIYRVTFKVLTSAGDLAGHTWRGQVAIDSSWSPPAWRFVRAALSLFWREAGF